jgi:DNA primase
LPKSGIISHDAVEEIRVRADIAQIIGETVTLKRIGSRLVGLCPFHKDTKPSFYVQPDRGAFKCFGCGVGGDVFRFVMETQRLAFPDAVRYLAERYGIEIAETAAGPSRPKGYRDRLFAANESALSFFRETLAQPEIGRPAREYLQQRATSKAMTDAFELGFAPESWDRLTNALVKRGVSLADAAAVGLIAAREKGDGYYDRFRNRLMFPVRNATGRVCAFSGRLLAGEGPKYVNSPESEIYSKGRTFFALNLAKEPIRKRDAAFVCEGNFDVLSMHQFGLTHTVAALGTAFTESHASLLEQHTKNVVFLFDGDEAGQKATAKMLEFYLHRDYLPRAAGLPPSEDPDSFLKAHGAEEVEKLANDAPSLLDFAVERLFQQEGRDEEGTARAMNAACALAARLTSPIRRGLLAKKLAERARLTEDEVRQQIDRARRGARAPHVELPKTTARQLPTAESNILAIILHFPGVKSERSVDEIPLALPDGPPRTMAERILAAPADAPIEARHLMRPDDEPELRNLAGELLLTPPPCEAKAAAQMLADALAACERRKLAAEADALKTEMDAALARGDGERADEINLRLFALRKKMKEIRF